MNLYNKLSELSDLIKPQSNPDEIINISKTEPWMKSIFGFTDSDISTSSSNKDKTKAIRDMLQFKAVYDVEAGKLITQQGIYNAGWFITPTVKEIKDLISSLNLHKGSPRIAVVKGKDIGSAHVDSLPYELFQGASQFNALEMSDIDKTHYDGIEIYINDNTQGPRTALACAPGTFVRNYWVTNEYGSQFNALENLKLSHTNGYLIWGLSPSEIACKITDTSVNDIMIPCMIYTQVAGVTRSGTSINKHVLNKYVHQIYSSGVPINRYRNGGYIQTQVKIAHDIVKAEYIGAIGMGIVLHFFDKLADRTKLTRPRINLTLIGAGVFGIPEDMIISLLKDAINEFKQHSFDVYIHGFSTDTANTISKQLSVPIVEYGTNLVSSDTDKGILSKQDIVHYNGQGKMIDVSDYLLVIPSDNGIEVYSLRDYQKQMLQTLIHNHSPQFTYVDESRSVVADLFREIGINSHLNLRFVGNDGRSKFFIDIKNDPHIGYAVMSNVPVGAWKLYDKCSKEITKWPIV